MARCATCGHRNPDGAKFCNECGARLTAAPSPRGYTPRHLVDEILRAGSEIQGERKQVTVLFADVKGSMEMAESVDAEEWHRLMDRFFAILSEGVHRYEGTVNQYTGDGIMALFGAPLAHEDHAQRACHAALYLREALRAYAHELRRERGLDLAVRIGINSGEVVVGTIGDDLRMDYTAQGHTVGLAARMEQLAEAGQVYLGEDTARLVDGYFQLADLGSFNVKGVRDPVRVHALIGPGALRTRLDAARVRGLSRFVGRAAQMEQLDAAMRRAHGGRSAIVGIAGEAGVGKSRLAAELIATCRRRGLAVFEAHVPAHARSIPHLAAAELYRSLFGITQRDGDRAAREKAAGRLVLLDESLGEHLPLVFEFLGIADPSAPPAPKDPEARSARLLEVARRVVAGAAAREPAVVLWEDLHWIDEASEAFLAALAAALGETRTLLLVSFRPEYDAPWLAQHEVERVPLGPLGEESVSELLHDLLGDAGLAAALASRIRRHTGGNPFFVEEVVQSLFERGLLARDASGVRVAAPLGDLGIPQTVHALLAARIDRLPEARRRALQTAAVIGKRFARSVLERVLDVPDVALGAALDDLVRAEFLIAETPEPDAEYSFKHPLTREVADQSQLGEHRVRVHAAVARAMETLYAERPDEHAALIAYHWEGAGERLAAARWLKRAMTMAARAGPREEIGLWRRIRDLLADADAVDALRLRVAACTEMIVLGARIAEETEDSTALFAEGTALADRLGEDGVRAKLLAAYGLWHGLRGGMAEALRLVGEARRVAAPNRDPVFRADVASMAVNVYDWFGCYRDMTAVCDEALALLETAPPDRRPLYSYLLMAKGLTLCTAGELRESGEVLERALDLARREQDAETSGRANIELAFRALDMGDAASALACAERAREIGERLGSGSVYGPSYVAIGAALAAAGRFEESVATLALVDQVLSHGRAGSTFRGVVLSYLALAHLGAGDRAQALRAAEESVEVTRRAGTRGYEIRAHLALARVLLESERAAAAPRVREALDRVEDLIEETGMYVYVPTLHAERGMLARALGDRAAADRELRAAERAFTEMGAPISAAAIAAQRGAI